MKKCDIGTMLPSMDSHYDHLTKERNQTEGANPLIYPYPQISFDPSGDATTGIRYQDRHPTEDAQIPSPNQSEQLMPRPPS